MSRFHIAAGFERTRRRFRERIRKAQMIKTLHRPAVRRDKSFVTELCAQKFRQQITASRAWFAVDVVIG